MTPPSIETSTRDEQNTQKVAAIDFLVIFFVSFVKFLSI